MESSRILMSLTVHHHQRYVLLAMALVLSVIVAIVVVAYLLKFVQSSSSLASYRELQANWTLTRQRVDTLRATYGENVREQYYSVAVVGESYNNSDGSSPQQIISTLEEGEPVLILREQWNEYDRHTIAVYVERAGWLRQIGYLSREDARLHAPEIDAGRAYRAVVRFNRCPTSDKPSRGVWLDLYRMEPPINRKSTGADNEKDGQGLAFNSHFNSSNPELSTLPVKRKG